MANRWRIRPVDLAMAIEEGVDHEPFGLDLVNDCVYTKEEYFAEEDEARSSTKEENQNLAGNEPDQAGPGRFADGV